MPALQHQPRIRPREPARLGDLVGVDGDLGGLGLADAAQHEGMRERPRLARVEGHLADLDAGLLQHLAAHGVLDVLAGLDEAGERRVHLVAVAVLVRQQAALAVGDQHDDHRIGAREPLQPAGPAFAPPAAVLDQRLCRRNGRSSGRSRAIGRARAPGRTATAPRAT